MSKETPRITHVIFDIGQTVVDSIRSVNAVLQNYARSKGKEWTGGMSSEAESMTEVFENFLIDIEDESYKYPDKFQNFVKEVSKNLFEFGFKMMPGALKLINHLHEHKIPMAFASNGDKKIIQVTLDKTDDLDQSLFSHFVAGDDDPEVKNNKPAPDIYLVCAKRFKTSPKSLDSCVIFEDSIRGISGAVATGMKTVLINDMPLDKIGEISDKVTVIVDSLENFSPESLGLPHY